MSRTDGGKTVSTDEGIFRDNNDTKLCIQKRDITANSQKERTSKVLQRREILKMPRNTSTHAMEETELKLVNNHVE